MKTEEFVATKNGRFNWLSLAIEVVKAAIIWLTAQGIG